MNLILLHILKEGRSLISAMLPNNPDSYLGHQMRQEDYTGGPL